MPPRTADSRQLVGPGSFASPDAPSRWPIRRRSTEIADGFGVSGVGVRAGTEMRMEQSREGDTLQVSDAPQGGVGGVDQPDRRRPAACRSEVGSQSAGHVSGGAGEVDAGGQAHEVADHVAAQAGVDLDQARAPVHQAHLDVLDAVGDAERLDGCRGDGGDLGEQWVGRVDAVGDLFEERRVAEGLAGDGDRGGVAAVRDALDSHFSLGETASRTLMCGSPSQRFPLNVK